VVVPNDECRTAFTAGEDGQLVLILSRESVAGLSGALSRLVEPEP
jgi:hypothetical protein